MLRQRSHPAGPNFKCFLWRKAQCSGLRKVTGSSADECRGQQAGQRRSRGSGYSVLGQSPRRWVVPRFCGWSPCPRSALLLPTARADGGGEGSPAPSARSGMGGGRALRFRIADPPPPAPGRDAPRTPSCEQGGVGERPRAERGRSGAGARRPRVRSGLSGGGGAAAEDRDGPGGARGPPSSRPGRRLGGTSALGAERRPPGRPSGGEAGAEAEPGRSRRRREAAGPAAAAAPATRGPRWPRPQPADDMSPKGVSFSHEDREGQGELLAPSPNGLETEGAGWGPGCPQGQGEAWPVLLPASRMGVGAGRVPCPQRLRSFGNARRKRHLLG